MMILLTFFTSLLIVSTGAHPVVEEKRIVCDLCQKGFQPVAGLQSHEYPFSECLPHSPLCDPEYGLSECQAGTAEVDIGCTCNASLGYSPKVSSEDCHCFTQSDPCSGCKFIGCPNGTVKNDRGLSALAFVVVVVYLLIHPPTPCINMEGYIGIMTLSVHPSVCSSFRVSDHVSSISPEPCNHLFLSNLVWWCIIMRQCVMQKNWFTTFNVKVTARVYVIKV